MAHDRTKNQSYHQTRETVVCERHVRARKRQKQSSEKGGVSGMRNGFGSSGSRLSLSRGVWIPHTARQYQFTGPGLQHIPRVQRSLSKEKPN